MSAPPSVLPVVLALVASILATPEDGSAILRRLSSGDPERRSEALRDLAADSALTKSIDRDRLVPRLRKLLESSRVPAARGDAARALRHVAEPDDLLAIVDRLRRETDDRAHGPLLDALDGVRDERVVAEVCQAASAGSDPRVRGLMALALGRLEGDRARRTLHRLGSRSGPWPVVTSSLISLGRKRHRDVVSLLVRRLRDRDPGIRAMAFESLTRLTGLSLGGTAEAWETWWAKSADGFRFPEPGGKVLGPGGRPYAPTIPVVARYYGIPIRGGRVAFCFDLSASMWGPTIEAAIEELTNAVKALPTRTRFTVVFFNEPVWRWRQDPSPALPWPKEALFAHLPTLTTKSYTNIHDALENALGLAGRGRFASDPTPGVDDVFLISDGEPNRGRFRDPKGIARSIRALNTPRAARIHCIALGEKPRALLARIAAENGGRFVDAGSR